MLGLPISPGRKIFRNLPEDPGVITGSAPDHHGIAVGQFNHADCVFWSDDVTVANDWDLDGSFKLCDADPVGLTCITLLPRARMQRNGRQAEVFGDLAHLHMHQFFVIPAGAELHRERNLDCRLDGLKDIDNQGQVAQTARATIAANHLLDRAAKVDVDKVEAQRFAVPRRIGHHLRIRPKQLRRNRMLFRLKTQVAFLCF